MSDIFLDRALKLIANGYRIIPVRAGEKRPGLKGWEESHATPEMARKWAANGFAGGNIGIVCEDFPAIDLDIYDAAMCERLTAWCIERFGEVPMRVGQEPKRLLMFAAAEPFSKMFATYEDKTGKKHKVEILGHGQQFVAYGIHPDTKQPFRWLSFDEPLDTPAVDLVKLTADAAREVLAMYGTMAKSAGWTYVGSSEGRSTVAVAEEESDLSNYKPTLKLTLAEIETALKYTDDADNYERWIMVGMALHHQSGGRARGLEMWQDWSSQADNYDGAACVAKWDSFKENSGKRMPVTFASVLKIANAREKVAKSEDFNRAMNVLRTATSEEEIFGPIAKQLAQSATAEYQFDIIAKKMQDRVFELTQVRPRIETVRKALAQAKNRGELVEAGSRPTWAQGWVYLKNADRFYHVDMKIELTEKGFNACFNRLLLSDEDKMVGQAMPSSLASQAALNLYNMPMADQKVYLPGMDKVLEINGRTCVNTYDESSVPDAKAPETDEEKLALETVKAHFKLLLPDETERNQVLDFLSYNVQFPTEKIVWAIVMQGAEGAGKTLILKLLARIMGPQNVGPLSATELEDKYTGWAESKKMVFIEEIRLHGANRYAILDKMKPFISNEEANVRRMNRDSYEIPNVTNYFMFTNYWDALPLSTMDRRYYVVSTWFQTKKQLDKFSTERPDYFVNLYNAINEHADVLRDWFLNRTLSDVFQPKRPAIDSAAKFKMRDQSEHSEEMDALEDALEASTQPDVSSRLLNVSKLQATMELMAVVVPYGNALSKLLTKAGFHSIGRFRDVPDQPPSRFYSREPDLFKRGEELETIRAIVYETYDQVDPLA